MLLYLWPNQRLVALIEMVLIKKLVEEWTLYLVSLDRVFYAWTAFRKKIFDEKVDMVDETQWWAQKCSSLRILHY